MPYEVSEDVLRMTDQAFEKIKNYDPSGADDFTLNLISVILLTLSREYEQLRAGYKKYTRLEAWACRNLLELAVFTKWVLRSGQNAKRFAVDAAVDGTELFESFKNWLAQHNPGIAAPKELDETLRLGYERRKADKTTGEKHLDVRALATEIGMLVDFENTMKLCSKLVHVTAFSLTMTDEGEYAAFRYILFNSGVTYGLDTFNTIKEHLESAAEAV